MQKPDAILPPTLATTKGAANVNTRLNPAKLIGLTTIALMLMAVTSAKADMYLQGSLGYGMIADFDEVKGSTTTSITGLDAAMPIGVEGGLDRLGAAGKLRAGVGYTQFDAKGGDLTSDIAVSVISANGYYYLDDMAVSSFRLKPYIGAGLGYVTLDGYDAAMGYLGHVGFDVPVQQNITIGGEYTYLMTKELTNSTDSTKTIDSFSSHIFSANVAYHLNGGLFGGGGPNYQQPMMNNQMGQYGQPMNNQYGNQQMGGQYQQFPQQQYQQPMYPPQ